MTDDEQAFIGRIIAEPGDDLPRLVFADWLEEHGRGERAEFIRVQCELAKWESYPGERFDGFTTDDGRRMMFTPTAKLVNRERELWGYHPSRDGVLRTLMSSLPGFAVVLGNDSGSGLTNHYPWAIVRRGFVAEVRMSLTQFMGEVCPSCQGRPGDSGYGGYTPFAGCPRCDGTGRTPGLAKGLFGAQPITSVVLTCREPLIREDGITSGVRDFNLQSPCFMFQWWGGDDTLTLGHRLPRKVMVKLFQATPRNQRWHRASHQTTNCFFPTREAALKALSDAACLYGRNEAGLPARQLAPA